jgi:hypothetical protein
MVHGVLPFLAKAPKTEFFINYIFTTACSFPLCWRIDFSDLT